METVDLIKKLRKNVAEIKDLFLRKIPIWKAKPDTYDKTRYGFVLGDGDGWYKSQKITLHFGSWAGTYGNSSVYKQIDLDGDVFTTHFLNYLNINKETIMLAIADSIEAEAAGIAATAEKELMNELDKLKELTVS